MCHSITVVPSVFCGGRGRDIAPRDADEGGSGQRAWGLIKIIEMIERTKGHSDPETNKKSNSWHLAKLKLIKELEEGAHYLTVVERDYCSDGDCWLRAYFGAALLPDPQVPAAGIVQNKGLDCMGQADDSYKCIWTAQQWRLARGVRLFVWCMARWAGVDEVATSRCRRTLHEYFDVDLHITERRA